MKNSEMQTQKILSFLYGDMNNNEQKLFLQDCKTDNELNAELNLHQQIDHALKKELEVNRFKNQLNNIHNQTIIEKKGKILNIQHKWYWAAASITVFTGTAFYSLSKQFQTPERLFKNYYETWNPGLTTRSVSNEIETQNILSNYESGDYKSTLNLIAQLDEAAKNNPQILLIKGCALMEQEAYKQAIDVFMVFNTMDYTLYTEAGNWYKALCYLKNRQIVNAKQILVEIIELEGTYSTEATELLTKVK